MRSKSIMATLVGKDKAAMRSGRESLWHSSPWMKTTWTAQSLNIRSVSSGHSTPRFFSSDITGKIWGRARHHVDLTGDHENGMGFHPLAVVYRGIKTNFKKLEFLDLYTPRGDKDSIEDYATVFNGSYKFTSTAKYQHIAQKFAGIKGMVIVTNPPKISIDVTESVQKLKSKRQVMVAVDQDKDWDVANECETSGVVPHGKKSVISKPDVLLIRQVRARLYYGPVYVNPIYKPTRFTIQIPSLNSEEFKAIQALSKDTLIDFKTANQLLERLEEMEERYLEPRLGLPTAPVIKIVNMEQAEFILNNFQLTFIDSDVASKLIMEEKQARKVERFGFFSQTKQSITGVAEITELLPDFHL